MNEKRWECFLTLQGLTDQNEPIPGLDIAMPLEGFQSIFDEIKVKEYLVGCKNLIVVGAGGGGEVVTLNSAGFNTTGITISYKDIGFAKKHYGIDLILSDMHDMSMFTCGQFDGGYSSNVIEHAISPLIVLCEIRRVLNVGGKFVLVVPFGGHGVQHYSVLSEELWLHLLDICGFDIMENSQSGGNFVFKVVRTNKDCVALHFEKMMKERGLWR